MADYIDRQEVIKKLEELDSRLMRGHYYDECEGVTMASAIVKSIPAADVKPVVHAHWKKSKEGVCGDYLFVCSACGADYWESPSYYKQAHYCPNCGAKMDKNLGDFIE